MITLRPYQQEIFDLAKKKLAGMKIKSILIQLPTGGGKTYIFTFMAAAAIKKKSKTLILTDRDVLLNDTGRSFRKVGIAPFFITAGLKNPPQAPGAYAYIAMAQTLKKRVSDFAEWRDWIETMDLIIIDECHVQEFNLFFSEGFFQKKTLIGVTATPVRTGKMRQLGQDYHEMISTRSTVDLIRSGDLVTDLHYDCGAIDTSDIKLVKKSYGMDFAENAMFKKFESNKCYSGIINAYKKNSPGEIMLVFCSNRIHTIRTCKKLNEAGIPAKFLISAMTEPRLPKGDEFDPVTNKMSPKFVNYYEKKTYFREYCENVAAYSGERHELISEWKKGKFKVMVNSGILTKGFDYPDIQNIGVLRAINSIPLWLQIVGRGSRPGVNVRKDFFRIYDFGGNGDRLGGYKTDHSWSLYHDHGRSGKGEPIVKTCGEKHPQDKRGNPGCGGLIFASAKICPLCGFLYPEKKEGKEVELSLASSAGGQIQKTKEIERMNFNELTTFAKANLLPESWVLQSVHLQGGMIKVIEYEQYKTRNYVQ